MTKGMETKWTRDMMKKSCPYFFPVKLHRARLRTGALILMAMIQMAVAVGPGHTSSARSGLVKGAGSIGKSQAQSRPCVTSAQTGSSGISKDGEYQPAYSARSVPHSDQSGRKYVGYHCWREIDSGPHRLRWESDAVNAMNDFIVCRYSLGGAPAKEVYLEFGPGTIDFTNKDGSGTGDALALAVYEGTAPTILFKGKAIDFGKPVFGPKKWVKLEKSSSLTIDQLKVPIKVRAGVKELSVVLVGVDSWIDTKVTIQISSLKLLSSFRKK